MNSPARFCVAVLRVGLLAALPVLAAWNSVAAEGPAFHGRPVIHGEARDFNLPDQFGHQRNAAEFRGKVVLMFFGFTQCPDVCPTEMARLAEVMRLLGPAADRVQVLFVTLDPQRDTRELLRGYLAAFSPSFLALRGSEAQVAEIAEAFQVYYRRIEGSAPGRYTLEHSAYVHALDPKGRLRLRIPGNLSPQQVAEDVTRLIAGE